eukprot:11508772-Ditylum_brightwellii.AAC.1
MDAVTWPYLLYKCLSTCQHVMLVKPTSNCLVHVLSGIIPSEHGTMILLNGFCFCFAHECMRHGGSGAWVGWDHKVLSRFLYVLGWVNDQA